MKTVFLYAISVGLILQVLLLIFSTIKRSKLSRIFNLYLGSGLIYLTTYTFFLEAREAVLASLFLGLCYSACDLLLVSLIFFFFSQKNGIYTPIKLTKTNFIFLSIIVLDIVVLIVNAFHPVYFKLNEVLRNNEHYAFKTELTYYAALHAVVNTLMISTITWDLIRKSKNTSRFFRNAYLSIGAITVLMFVLQVLPIAFPKNRVLLDYSIILTPLVALYFYLMLFRAFPREDAARIISRTADKSSYSLFFFDTSRKCVYKNSSALKFELAVRENIVQGEKIDIKGFLDRIHSNLMENSEAAIKETININLKRNGLQEKNTLDVTYAKILDHSKVFAGTYLKIENRTRELQKLRDEKHKACHDQLTNLLNKQEFFNQAEEILKNAGENSYLLLAADVVNFKFFNNQFSNKIGDKILVEIASTLQKECDKGISGRISGDKFAVLISREHFNRQQLSDGIRKIQGIIPEISYKLQITVGVYEIANIHEGVQIMFDKACLAGKTIEDDYSQTVAFYDTNLMDKLKHEQSIVNDFENAIKQNQFNMYLQPQIDQATNKVIGAEALVRWIHPEHGIMAPGLFVGILENKGYVHKMDSFIWEEAVRKLAEWRVRGIDYYISVNISAKDFHYLNIYNIFTNLVERYGVSPKKLNLEITETILMNEIRSTKAIIQRLRDYGFHVEMDDFGSGYSSLNTLKNLKMDTLKIDMEFLRQTDNIQRSEAILAEVIHMAKNLGMEVISEGVETQAHVDFLRANGTDIFQGYYFSKPISVTEFESRYITQGGNN